jgi:hypothetical protein
MISIEQASTAEILRFRAGSGVICLTESWSSFIEE